MNVFSVGGLGYSGGLYDVRWQFSSRGLSNYSDPVNGLVSGVRTSVDLLAPAQNLSALRYGGATGGNNPTLAGSIDVSTRDSSGLFGTSFSTPIVAGAAALLYSLSREKMPTNGESRDARVIKAVLLNSADKLQGWDAALTFEDGLVWTTRQGLDAAQGAGRLNLEDGYDQYAPSPSTQTGISGTGAPLSLLPSSGWDLGNLERGSSFFYELADIVYVDSWLTGTLVWYRERRSVNGSTEDLKQANLDLLLWRADAETGGQELVGQSISVYNLVEHLDLELSQTGRYWFEVRYEGDTFALLGASDSETFALAWDLQMVPERSNFALVFGLAGVLLALTRRR
jgi:hypothetical protein